MRRSEAAAASLRLAFCGERLLFLDAVAQLLVRRGHYIAASAPTVEELLPQLEQQGAEVVVVDEAGGDPVGNVARLCDVVPHASVLVILDPRRSGSEGTDLGGVRFVSRSSDVHELVQLVEQLGDPGGSNGNGSPRRGSRQRLTNREREVLLRLSNGETTAELARNLGIAESTAREHVQNLLRKLGVHTRAQAVSSALGRGLL